MRGDSIEGSFVMKQQSHQPRLTNRVRRLIARLDEDLHPLRAVHQSEAWELELAVRVHESLLPRPIQHPRLEVAVRYVPAGGLGGDYCQVLFPNESTCCISICDVTGHGVGPALLATRVSSEVRRLTHDDRRPREILANLNSFLLDYFGHTELQVSFFVARVDLDRRMITYSSGGHPGPLLVRRRDPRQIEPLKSQNFLLGVTEQCLGDEPEDTLSFAPGDRLMLYTDGLTEVEMAAAERLGETGLIEIVRNLPMNSVSEDVDAILRYVVEHRYGPPHDDLTLLAVEFR
jgi:sigma-B regulation protein RsbU (phosphoserine phosphatase)